MLESSALDPKNWRNFVNIDFIFNKSLAKQFSDDKWIFASNEYSKK